MFISKSDLYKTGWLDLVFAKRNKEYGAYYLRQHSNENTVKAMGITFISVISVITALSFVMRAKPVEVFKTTEVVLKSIVTPPVPPKKEEVHQVQSKPAAPKNLVVTTKFVPPVVVPQPVAVEPPKLNDMKGEIGPVDIVIPEGTGAAIPSVDAGKGGDGTAVKANDPAEVFTTAGVDEEPEPIGGSAAWAKFLQKNLKYPPVAMEQGISGKVYISFIVEKDGRISTVQLIRGAGYGMDEESIRVLKMAPLWKPGKQHGTPVRVKYTLPLNFTINQ